MSIGLNHIMYYMERKYGRGASVHQFFFQRPFCTIFCDFYVCGCMEALMYYAFGVNKREPCGTYYSVEWPERFCSHDSTYGDMQKLNG